jgi:uncharacterized protein (DUF305 family)
VNPRFGLTEAGRSEPNTTKEQGVVLKTLLRKAWPLALLLAATLVLTACGGEGGGQQGNGSDDGGHGMAENGGMDHDQMGHGSMGKGSGGMAKQMVTKNGEYSDEVFIDAMVPHHQGAIAMAKVALKNAEHEEIKELSRNILASQQAEIEELKAIKKEEFGTSDVPMEMSSEQMRGMGVMMDPQSLANKEPFDEAFIEAMIPHHRSAIDMATVANQESEDPRIKELAENIVSAQKGEIEQMKGWREQWYQEG